MPKPSPRRNRLAEEQSVRIVGGDLRGRRLTFLGDPQTRPMKDRVREAVFNLLGPDLVRRCVAIDLFAGTGALAFEAISRGAQRAFALESNFQMGAALRYNADQLGIRERIEIVVGDTFIWSSRLDLPEGMPWVVFCSPPYRLFHEQADKLLGLIGDHWERAPTGSALVVESDTGFDAARLPHAESWEHRTYPPAVVHLLR